MFRPALEGGLFITRGFDRCLVLLDNESWHAAAERMRALKPGIKVLFMSGYARPVLASQGRLDPNVALVEKPFSEADLLSMAGQVLNGHFPGFTTGGVAA